MTVGACRSRGEPEHPWAGKTGPMLRKVSIWQHLLVGVSIVVMALLAGFGVIGAGDESVIRPEHFDAKQVTVWPDGLDGVWVREVVDIDFGLTERRGYQRFIPNDFGAPADISADSPDANAQLDVVVIGDETRVRLGDPDVTFTGRRRYVLEYRLPDANVSSGRLDLDIIGNDETFETQRFEVALTGFDFESIECLTGAREAFGGCEFSRGELDNLVAVIEPLAPGDGITVSGVIRSLSTPTMPSIPDPPGRIPTGFRPFGLLMIPLGVAAAALVYFVGRAAGSNTVVAGGAAEAAFGELPMPGEQARRLDVATYRVPDSRLAELATIEFAPPRGLEPWQAAVVLREAVDDDSVAAWFSEMIADGALVADEDAGAVRLTRGAETSRLNAVDLGHLERLFGHGDVVELGSYDKEFTATWNSIRSEQLAFASNAGWWSRGGPGGRTTTPSKVIGASIALLAVAVRDRRGCGTGDHGGLLEGVGVTIGRGDRWTPRAAGGRGHRVPADVRLSYRHRLSAGAAVRVVPAVPGRQRGTPRRLGVGARAPPRVQRLGGRARRAPRHGRWRSRPPTSPTLRWR